MKINKQKDSNKKGNCSKMKPMKEIIIFKAKINKNKEKIHLLKIVICAKEIANKRYSIS